MVSVSYLSTVELPLRLICYYGLQHSKEGWYVNYKADKMADQVKDLSLWYLSWLIDGK